MTRIAFDVDGTLIKQTWDGLSVPNWRVINLVHAFAQLGVEVYVWSGGGTDYATQWRDKLGLDYAKIAVKEQDKDFFDIAIDDEDVDLAKVNIKV